MGYGVTTSSKVVLSQGATVTGKWNGRTYRIERLLGEGANGKVFLVRQNRQPYAMKFGFDALDLQMEVNALRALDRKRGRPFLLDVDDAEWNGVAYPYYVMRYVPGVPPESYMSKHGADWFYLIGLNVLRSLERLHRLGYVYADLKPGNVLVSGYGETELIDYGGVTAKGRSVRQFTELFDRGYWNAGERTADESYDLFGFAVLCLQIGGSGKRLQEAAHRLPQNRSVHDLLRLIDENPLCKTVAPVLVRALRGNYSRSADAVADWVRAIEARGLNGYPKPVRTAAWIKAAFVSSIGLFASALYLFLQRV